jgi:tetratricopeptide (TPR) repeat protein
MRWLREIRVRREANETFTQVVERVLPTLAEALTAATGQRAADLRAHLGWADFLRTREGAAGQDPAAHYRKALADDPANVYAHAMWGHHQMVQRGSIAEARQHFESATTSGREREFVRRLQFAAMFYFNQTEAAQEGLRIASDMRTLGETVEDGVRDRLWSSVYSRLLRNASRAELLAGLQAKDLLETFLWLYPENEVRPDRRMLWRFYAGILEEAAGEKAAARSRFERLQADLDREGVSGPLKDEVKQAMLRLGRR